MATMGAITRPIFKEIVALPLELLQTISRGRIRTPNTRFKKHSFRMRFAVKILKWWTIRDSNSYPFGGILSAVRIPIPPIVHFPPILLWGCLSFILKLRACLMRPPSIKWLGKQLTQRAFYCFDKLTWLEYPLIVFEPRNSYTWQVR